MPKINYGTLLCECHATLKESYRLDNEHSTFIFFIIDLADLRNFSMRSLLTGVVFNFILGIGALPDGLHKSPPMGWTSWNAFFGYCNEEKMMSQVSGCSKRT